MRSVDLCNVPERLFEELAERSGWWTTKRGWPDFLCFSQTGEVIAVEVKPRSKSGRLKILKKEQADCMDELTAHGIRCFVSDGVTLEKYSRAKHRPENRVRNHWKRVKEFRATGRYTAPT